PPVAQLDTALEGIGVSDRSRIVIYGAGATMTARLFMTLEYLGAGARTSILDGGLAAWRADARRAVATDVPKIARGSFTPHVNKSVVVDADFVKANIEHAGLKILDARAPQFYNGDPGGMPRGGHVPSALNIPFNTLLLDNGRFKD